MNRETFFGEARRSFHAALFESVLHTDAKGIPSNADKHSKQSVRLAVSILQRLGAKSEGARLAGQMAGNKFEEICKEFIEETFLRLTHLRPGHWQVSKGAAGGRLGIAQFDQYEHLAALDTASQANADLAAALGTGYLIRPDIIIFRYPEDDAVINEVEPLVDRDEARQTPIRKLNSYWPILHASISCKWTIRSDRSQNARSEALNLVRNRKGPLPHIAVVTGEPAPNRIAFIALGTGDIDCVYHFALPELAESAVACGFEDASELLNTMVEGKRLRDISDLPLDLAI